MSVNQPYHVSIEIVNNKCKGLSMLESLGVGEYRLSDVRGLAEGSTRHLIKIPKEKVGRLPKNKFARISSSGETWFDSDGCEICKAILYEKSFLISATHLSDYTMIYDFVVPDYKAFQNIVLKLEGHGLSLKILEVTKFKPKMTVLAEKQERTLWLALKLGFFDYPRKIDSVELSKKLGIAPSTLSEITRRGMRRLLRHFFDV